MTKTDRKIRKMIFGNLDRLYKISVNTSKEFDMKAITLPILKHTINLSKIKLNKENEVIHEYLNDHNKTLDDIYDTCKKHAEKFKSDKVPFATLKQCVVFCKTEMFKED